MYTLVLTAPLGRLDHNSAEAVSKAMGRALHWLEPATAAEIQVGSDGPGACAAARAALKSSPVDANIVPTFGRRKKLLIADMDSTMISCECIDEIADMAGLKPQVAAITERSMRGELPFEASLTERVALLMGLPVTDLARVYAERVHLNPGARALVQTMRQNGALTALVSGGFTFFTERVAEAAGFEINRANTLMVHDGHLTGRVADPILGAEAKLESLETFAQMRGLSLSECLAVGDGANDLSMIKAAGMSVAYHAKPILREAASTQIDHSDLTALLYLQGYRSDEIMT